MHVLAEKCRTVNPTLCGIHWTSTWFENEKLIFDHLLIQLIHLEKSLTPLFRRNSPFPSKNSGMSSLKSAAPSRQLAHVSSRLENCKYESIS